MNIISIGSECSTAATLKTLQLRTYALPFDWVQTTSNSLFLCIQDGFSNFHKNLKLSLDQSRIIDHYGIEYPHDYPVKPETEFILPDGNKKYKVVDNWQDEVDEIYAKYQRRISRFNQVFENKSPIIILYRGTVNYAYKIQELLKDKYNHGKIIFVVATIETKCNYSDIIICNPEANGGWNNTSIWKDAIERAYLLCQRSQPVKRSWKLF